MNEKLLKKIKKSLEKLGLEEDKIESVMSEIQADDSKDGDPEGQQPPVVEPSPAEPSAEGKEPESESSGEGSEPTPPEPVGKEGEGEPIPPSVEPEPSPVPSPEGPSVEEEPVPPAEPEPPVDPVADLKVENEELRKVVDALSAKVDSLTDALRQANILHEEGKPVGVDKVDVDANDESINEEEILSKLNR